LKLIKNLSTTGIEMHLGQSLIATVLTTKTSQIVTENLVVVGMITVIVRTWMKGLTVTANLACTN
jgi:hypothetical protein